MALKVYNKQVHPNAEYEHEILKLIESSNIVKVFKGLHNESEFCMEMEYCISQDLARIMWNNKQQPYAENFIKHLGHQLFSGLLAAHRQEVIHCNLKSPHKKTLQYFN